jgi:hypothetical protein
MVVRSQRLQARSVRYYLYISDSKLDMLFEQIDRGVLKRISGELKVDLHLASLTLRGTEGLGTTRMAKLRVVERFIDKHRKVGTIQEPGLEFFRGKMNMHWGIPIPGRGVWFQGNDYERSQCVGLGGSSNHVLGTQSPTVDSDRVMSASALPEITNMLEHQEFLTKPSLQQTEEAGDLPWLWRNGLLQWRNETGDGSFYGLIPQWLEFLAIPLAETQVEWEHPVHVVIGTPLYVAMARE